MKKLFFISLLFVLFAGFAKADFEMRFKENPLIQGRLATLVIESDEDISDVPDMSSFEDYFKVVSTSVSTKVYILNGKAEKTSTLDIGLIPLKVGKITLGNLRIGGKILPALDVEIAAGNTDVSAQKQNAETKGFALSGKILPSDSLPYVQQMLVYEVTLKNVENLRGDEPVFEDTADWKVKKLGAQKSAGGKDISFFYALFAQKSGVLKIPTVYFEGETLLEDDDFSDFSVAGLMHIKIPSVFMAAQPVHLAFEGPEIQILSAKYDGKWWLPAEDVSLKAYFSGQTKFMAGEPLTRVVNLKASGVLASQLPELVFEDIQNAKQYPQKTQTSETVEGLMPVASAEYVNVYIPQAAGKIFLPDEKVEWFDIKTQTLQTAVLKGVEIDVLENPDLKKDVNLNVTQEKNPVTENTEVSPEKKHSFVLTFLTAFCLGVLVVLGVLKVKSRREPAEVTQKNESAKKVAKDVLKFAKKGDLKALQKALILWAGAFYGQNAVTLKDVAGLTGDEDFEKQIEKINAALYAQNVPQAWDFSAFEKSFEKILKKQNTLKRDRTPLPPLYQ